jgi:phosphate transport system substrate-binding protein
MNLNNSLILVLCLTLLTGCKSNKSENSTGITREPAKKSITGSFSISGAYALYPLAQKWAAEFMKLHPAVKIEVTANGTGQGIKDLLEKKTTLVMISRSLTDEELDTGLFTVPVVRDGVAPIINQENPYINKILQQGISPDKLIRLFTVDKPMTWGEVLDTLSKERALTFTRADESGAAAVWANFLFKEEKDLTGQKVSGDLEMIKSIRANPLSIGYCNFSFAFDENTGERIEGIQVVPIDLDFDRKIDKTEIPFINISRVHRGIWLGFYPKNLSRELTFGTLGKPTDPVVVEFLKYVLSDGQVTVRNSNFCELNNVYLNYELQKLK